MAPVLLIALLATLGTVAYLAATGGAATLRRRRQRAVIAERVEVHRRWLRTGGPSPFDEVST